MFLFFSLSLVLPSGFSYGAILLLLTAIPFLFIKSTWKHLNKEHLLFIFAFCFYAIVWFAEALIHDLGLSEYDKPSRFILACIVLLYLLKHKPKQSFLWAGIVTGAWGTGIWAISEKLLTNVARVDAHTNAIQYGNISMLLGLLCLAGFIWAFQREKQRILWITVCLIGFLLGITASILSGSRGGWIGTPLIIIYILQHYRNIIPKRFIVIGSVILIGFSTAAYMIPSSGIKTRINQAVSDISVYKNGKTNTSVGTRFELWEASLLMIKEKPLLGWGKDQYFERLVELKNTEVVNPHIISHSHNEFLYVGARRGVLGLLSLIILYTIPLTIYMHRINQLDSRDTAIPLAGVVTVVAYFDFGLTQAFLTHNNGVMIYTLALVIFLLPTTPKRGMYN